MCTGGSIYHASVFMPVSVGERSRSIFQQSWKVGGKSKVEWESVQVNFVSTV